MSTRTVFVSDDNENDELEIKPYFAGDDSEGIQFELSIASQKDYIYFSLHRDAAKKLLLELIEKLY